MSAHDPRPVGEDDLHARIDDRLDPARQAVVESWLASNPDVAARVSADREFRERLRKRLAPIAAEPIPARLRIGNLAVRRPPSTRRWLPMVAAIAMAIEVGGAAGWLGRGAFEGPAREIGPMTRDAVIAHQTFVVEAIHPVEVRADEKPHLVQWLSRRLDQALTVPDLASQGFRLMGGRIVPAEDRPAALLMYDDDAGKRLTLYVRSAGGNDARNFRYARDGDVAAFSWTDGSLAYVVTARTDKRRLLTIAQAIYGEARRTFPP